MCKKFFVFGLLVSFVFSLSACLNLPEPSPELTETPKIATKIIPNTPTITLTATPRKTNTPSPITYVEVTVNLCNLRSGPGTDYPVIGSAEKGQELPVFGRNQDGSWLLIDWSQSVWVGTSVIGLSGDILSIGIVDVDSLDDTSFELNPTKPISFSPTANTTSIYTSAMEESISEELEDALDSYIIRDVKFDGSDLIVFTRLERDEGLEEFYSEIGLIHGTILRINPPVEAIILDDITGQTIETPMDSLIAFHNGEIGWDEFKNTWIVVNAK